LRKSRGKKEKSGFRDKVGVSKGKYKKATRINGPDRGRRNEHILPDISKKRRGKKTQEKGKRKTKEGESQPLYCKIERKQPKLLRWAGIRTIPLSRNEYFSHHKHSYTEMK